MKSLNIAILGCGTVGGGVAQIINETRDELSERAGCAINLSKIVEIYPKSASERFGLPMGLFYGGGEKISKEEASKYIEEVIQSDEIDLVVETIGGSNDFIEKLAIDVCQSGKHLVTANKALLAERGKKIFKVAEENDVAIGFEASVCGAIPVIKTIRESFSGDEIISLSGIMNGTSNYILSMMQDEGLGFDRALKMAQDNGYAEADPTLDINGFDAGHKLVILCKLAFGIDISMDKLSVKGVETIDKEDIAFAKEIDCNIKLICYAKKTGGKVYATVCPMMVKKSNSLAHVSGATNAVRAVNKYSGRHMLLGSGAGSLETASSIVADIVFIARYAQQIPKSIKSNDFTFVDPGQFEFPYIITFETEDIPGITGLITTSIGNQNINIDTVSHNRHNKDRAIFSVATMPCKLEKLNQVIDEIKKNKKNVLLNDPKIIPILY